MRKKVLPKKAWISLTGVCNNQCKWCYRNGNETQIFIDYEKVKAKIKTFAEIGIKTITIIGGEPTLHPNFKEIINEIIKFGMTCIIVTNGRKKIEIPEKWKDNPLVKYVFSLHGANEEHYFKNTSSKNGFTEMIENVTYLKKEGVKLSVNIVLGKEMIDHLDIFYKLINKLSIKKLNFTYAVPSVDDENYEAIPLRLVELTKKIYSDCTKNNIKSSFILSLPWCLLGKDDLKYFIENKLISFNCPVNYGKGFLLKENGAIALCTHLSNYEILNAAKSEKVLLNAKNFINFWNSKKIKELRKTVNVYRHEKCVKCDYRFNCKGGCPLWWQRFDFGDIINSHY
ncbi:MAG: radical SAM protein [Patescibacteria group bacterium]